MNAKMKVLFDFKPYKCPRRAIYYETGDKYALDAVSGDWGWARIEREALVIGEDDTAFVTELIEHRNCDTEEPDYNKVCLMPIGFHKSRLIQWMPTPSEQLELFQPTNQQGD